MLQHLKFLEHENKLPRADVKYSLKQGFTCYQLNLDILRKSTWFLDRLSRASVH